MRLTRRGWTLYLLSGALIGYLIPVDLPWTT